MSTGQTWQIESASLAETLKAAAMIGRKLQGGETIVLGGDLGSGKTAFVRGLAKGMGSKDRVHSPSFTISNQYNAGRLTLHHFDFHRLNEAGIMRQELAEVVTDPDAVAAIEWGNVVEDVLPGEYIAVRITPVSDTVRLLQFTCPFNLKYLKNLTC